MSKTICLVGNPNAGKTTIFNGLTGARQRVGNWAGVTVEHSEGSLPDPTGGDELTVIDLPGLYSLVASSDDERVARDALFTGTVDLVVNVVDASNLERNLYLTTQLLELDLPLLVVLSMNDIAQRAGIIVDEEHLSHHLGVPVVAVNGTAESDRRRLRRAVRGQIAAPVGKPARVRYPEPVEQILTEWERRLRTDPPTGSDTLRVGTRWAALHLLEATSEGASTQEGGNESDHTRGDHTENGTTQNDHTQHDHAGGTDCGGDGVVGGRHVIDADEVAAARRRVRDVAKEEIDIVVADGRFGFVHGVTADVIRSTSRGVSLTERIDRVVLHPILGIPIFLAAMYAVFWVTIALGGAAIDFFDILAGSLFVDGSRAVLSAAGAPAWLELIVSDGVGAGLQTVATFVPVIFAMFLMLSLLENSGYMARAAFVMDRLMRRIGLPGKSFVPLLVGFGCTVPAIIGTRTLESRKDRLMTVFIAPLMSCGARLPVYALFAAAFFPAAAGVVVFSLYMAGIVVAIATGILLKHTLFPGEASHLVMELPPYHRPQIRSTLVYTWTRMKSFIKNAGTTIAVAVALLAVLNNVSWPRSDESVLARAGKVATPVFASIGIDDDNWPATVGLFTGLFAKEAIVGTLNSLYLQAERADGSVNNGSVNNGSVNNGSVNNGEGGLLASSPNGFNRRADGVAGPIVAWALRQPTVMREAGSSLWEGVRSPGFGLSGEHGSGSGDIGRLRRHFSPAAAYAYLLFVLLYLPCLAAFGTALKELGGRYGTLLAIYLVGVAWATSTLFYQIVEGHGVGYASAAVAVLAGLVLLFVAAGRRNIDLRGVPA